MEVEVPRKLVHTWEGAAKPGEQPSTVTYVLDPIADGTRITLRQAGFVSAEVCTAFAMGWETSLQRLAEMLDAEPWPRR